MTSSDCGVLLLLPSGALSEPGGCDREIAGQRPRQPAVQRARVHEPEAEPSGNRGGLKLSIPVQWRLEATGHEAKD